MNPEKIKLAAEPEEKDGLANMIEGEKTPNKESENTSAKSPKDYDALYDEVCRMI